MMKPAYPTEHSGRNSSGEDSLRRGTVKDRISLLRDGVPRHFERRVSLPVVNVKSADGPCRRGEDCYFFRNAVRGLVYAFLPSVVLWAIIIGLIYSLVKR